MTNPTPSERPPRYSARYFAVVAAAFLLRAALVWRGGQFFWNDEVRYTVSQAAARSILAGHFADGVRQVFSSADHLLFKVLAIIPALVQLHWNTGLRIPDLFLAGVSTGCIAMIGVVAAAAGAEEAEVFLATLLAAASSSLYYYTRHFFPYDLSLGFLLVGLAVGLRRPAGVWGMFLAGAWVSLGFLSYNGYWTAGGTILVVLTLDRWQGFKPAALRAAGGFAGLVAPIAATLVVGLLFKVDLIKSAMAFSGTINEGDFRVAWRLIPEYLYVTEHGLFLLWVAGLGAGLYALARGTASSRLRTWLALFGVLLLFLVALSDVIPKFPAAARYIRMLVPFLCLATAAVVAPWWARTRPRRSLVWTIALLAVIAQAGFNFWSSLALVFPDKFKRASDYVVHASLKTDLGPYEVVNDGFLHAPDWIVPEPDPGRVLLKTTHPFVFRPFLYEGYNQVERDGFEKAAGNLSMRLVRLAAGGPAFAGYPGPIRLTVNLQKRNLGYYPEPLLTTGVTGASDMIYLRHEDPADPSLFAVGFDDWGGTSQVSAPVHLDLNVPHVFTISIGSLLPPESDPLFTQHPELVKLKRRLYLKVDDTVVFNSSTTFHPAASDAITLGMNLVGASDAIDQFTTPIAGWSRVEPAALVAAVGEGQRQAGNLPPFKTYPGALRLTLTLAAAAPGITAEPLLSTGVTGAGDLLFLSFLPPTGDQPAMARVGLDHWGIAAVYSAPFPLDRGNPHTLVVSLGSLFPPATDASFRAHPDWLAAKQNLFVSVDDQEVLSQPMELYPSEPLDIVLGSNAIGASSASSVLRITDISLQRVPPAEITKEITDSVEGRYGRRLTPVNPALGGYPGALELQFQLPEEPGDRRAQPLLATGVTGAGDVIYLRYADPAGGTDRIVIGYDHWGTAVHESAPIQIDREQPHTLVVSLGSLFPATADPALRQKSSISLDGDVVIDAPVAAYASTPGQITVGSSGIGASSSTDRFLGKIVAVRSVGRSAAK